MNDSQNVPKQNKLTGIVVAILIVVLIGSIAAAYATGYVKVGQNVATVNKGGLCEDTISTYNSAFTQTDVQTYASKLADSAKAAAAVSDNESDPNCVYMQFTNAVNVRNSSDATKFAGLLESLASEGKYITGQLANPLGIDAIKVNAAAVTTSTGETTNPNIDGNG
jgi:flagellar basal body-associated protein FliL